ncbi:hypothetical protein [Kordiimonas marina]|uniref:hypothetical protein n=1 Tax=Kordiimonas marina TaxID=2872312 RepID=UPI001FF41A4E|nr:hypothetical protein [Kordiimonas marina]MCJ9428662.1 hypothetical protein [Kordiimonas marina]
MNQHSKPFVAFTFLAGALTAVSLVASSPAMAAGTAGAKDTKATAQHETLLAYAPDAVRKAYLDKVEALKKQQKAEWQQLQRDHKTSLSNPLLSKDDRAIMEKQQAEENKAAKETYAGQLQVLREQYADETASPA